MDGHSLVFLLRGRYICHWYDNFPPLDLAFRLTIIDSGCTLEQLTAKFINRRLIDFGDVIFGFDSGVRCDLDAMVSEFAGWMSHKHLLPASTFSVGILSSAKLTQQFSSLADEDLIGTFNLLLESSSVLYNYNAESEIYWKDYSMDDLQSIRSFAGTSVLRHLERVLSNIALAEASLKKMKALFLIPFGTIITVRCSRPIGYNQGVSNHTIEIITQEA